MRTIVFQVLVVMTALGARGEIISKPAEYKQGDTVLEGLSAAWRAEAQPLKATPATDSTAAVRNRLRLRGVFMVSRQRSPMSSPSLLTVCPWPS
jgi:hypothetical protein